jgi:hypothetical protein
VPVSSATGQVVASGKSGFARRRWEGSVRYLASLGQVHLRGVAARSRLYFEQRCRGGWKNHGKAPGNGGWVLRSVGCPHCGQGSSWRPLPRTGDVGWANHMKSGRGAVFHPPSSQGDTYVALDSRHYAVLWLLGLLANIGGGLIHILLVVAVIVLIIHFVQGRSRV